MQFFFIYAEVRDGFAIAWIRLFILAQYYLSSYLNKVSSVYIIKYQYSKRQTILTMKLMVCSTLFSHSSSCLQVKAADNRIIQQTLNEKVSRLLTLTISPISFVFGKALRLGL